TGVQTCALPIFQRERKIQTQLLVDKYDMIIRAGVDSKIDTPLVLYGTQPIVPEKDEFGVRLFRHIIFFHPEFLPIVLKLITETCPPGRVHQVLHKLPWSLYGEEFLVVVAVNLIRIPVSDKSIVIVFHGLVDDAHQRMDESIAL